MIGDRSHDMIGAKHNGMAGIGVLYGYGSRDELIAAGALRLCATPAGHARTSGLEYPPAGIRRTARHNRLREPARAHGDLKHSSNAENAINLS